jgi:glutaconate CoA-transferase subunit B
MEKDSVNKYNHREMMIVAAAREINDHDIVFIGVGAQLTAAYLAKLTHAPNAKILFESGIIDSNPVGMPIGIADPRLSFQCAKTTGIYYALSLLQRGYVDISFLGCAEVDKYGNLNSTVIGNYQKPSIRFPGSGGANDAASHSKKVVILVLHEKRRFPEKVSYVTSPGFIDGPLSREKAGLRGGGPIRVITNLGVLGFDQFSKKMRLESIHRGVTLSNIQENTGFNLILPEKIPLTKPPSPDQLNILRKIEKKH